jgi:hypothetical protein
MSCGADDLSQPEHVALFCVASLLGVGSGGAGVPGEIVAAGQSNQPRVLSGSDLGVRIDGTARDGALSSKR